MLIQVPEHTRADLEAWAKVSAHDLAVGRSRTHRRKVAAAIEAIRAFASRGTCYVGVSWGKDSVVVAHLSLVAEIPLRWFPAGEIENPHCTMVRDAFLAAFPGADYHEHPATLDVPWDGIVEHDGAQEAFVRESRRWNRGRYVSGVRAGESKSRDLRMRKHGPETAQTCAPIGWWTSADVFGYLAANDLPIHPAYAMTFGGVLDRARIRVGTLGGRGGRGRGRGEWEEHYYREHLERIRRAARGATTTMDGER